MAHYYPAVSQLTIEKLQADGFRNTYYTKYDMPACWTPRTRQYDLYTYFIVAAGVLTAFVAKRYNHNPHPAIFASLAAVPMALYQKVQTDNYNLSYTAKLNPRILLEQYPTLKEAYQIVSGEVDKQIQDCKQRIRVLEAEIAAESKAA